MGNASPAANAPLCLIDDDGRSVGVNHQQIGAVQGGDVLRPEIHELGPALFVMYRKMVTIRRFDQRAVEEVHAGNILGGRPRLYRAGVGGMSAPRS